MQQGAAVQGAAVRRGLIALLCIVIAGCGGGGSGSSNIGVNARVPDVVGQTQAAATSAITGAGLHVGTVSMASSATVVAGSVISQNPAANALVPPASTVNLVVSSGPAPTVNVPNVVGQTQAAATTAITSAGLHVGTVTNASSTTVPSGNVISQVPVAGTSVATNSTVNLTVSSGSNPPFGINTRPPVANFTLPNQAGGGGAFALADAFPSLPAFDQPVFLTAVPAPDTRLVVVEQTGRVKVFTPSAGVSSTSTILDVSSLIVAGGEQGLLGLAFDPDFTNNDFFYVFYTASDWALTIARYTWDPTTASAGSPKIILSIPHSDATNHNGGMLAFGPVDHMLYIGTGDGGGGDDQFHNGQNLSSLLAKILRIDVHPQNLAKDYDVPPDNPFVARAGAAPEIWAMGLRNPFRFSFDRQTGDLWVGDVGQNQWEEIDIVTKGLNYGWPRFEGNNLYQSTVALANGTTYAGPIFAYPHPPGVAIIGGYVYRGSRLTSLFGRYVYSDYGAGTVWAINADGTNNTPLSQDGAPTSFGEDNNGELYVVDQGGRILQLQDSGGGGSQPTLLSQTGLFTNLPLANPSPQTELTPASGLIEYDLNIPFWSDGAIKRRWVAIPGNANVTFAPTDSWTFPNGTVIVKHFEMELTEGNPNTRRRLETRLLISDSSGNWMGFTYKWNDAQTDADLLASGESENLTVHTSTGDVTWPYSYPSRTDCLQCHTAAANRALGLTTPNMNRDFDYGAVTDNQLRTLNHINYFSTNIGAATQYGVYPALTDTNATVAARARAYLAVNCAQCHRPGTPTATQVNLDFRFDTADAATHAIDVAPTQGDLGIGASARIIASGSKENSVLWERMRRADPNPYRMPPLGTHRIDQAGVDLIGQWIDELP
jgi:uncharacterized repeat protein (TIGR03806 family)